MNETKTEVGYLCHLTTGGRGDWRLDVCFAESSAAARELVERLNPGYRCFAVRRVPETGG